MRKTALDNFSYSDLINRCFKAHCLSYTFMLQLFYLSSQITLTISFNSVKSSLELILLYCCTSH